MRNPLELRRYAVEAACYTSDAATREKIQKRIQLFPKGFLVAELEREIIGIINSGSTNKEDITDEAFKDMVGHRKDGKNMLPLANRIASLLKRWLQGT